MQRRPDRSAPESRVAGRPKTGYTIPRRNLGRAGSWREKCRGERLALREGAERPHSGPRTRGATTFPTTGPGCKFPTCRGGDC